MDLSEAEVTQLRGLLAALNGQPTPPRELTLDPDQPWPWQPPWPWRWPWRWPPPPPPPDPPCLVCGMLDGIRKLFEVAERGDERSGKILRDLAIQSLEGAVKVARELQG